MTEIVSANVTDKGQPGIGARLWDMMGRRPEMFTLLLIIVTCVVVIAANPDFL